MKIYLAGPMSGIPLYNFPKFARYALKLRITGNEVISPAELNEGEQHLEETPERRARCLKKALQGLLECDTIALIPGWEKSKGARLEFNIAGALGYKIINLFPEELTR